MLVEESDPNYQGEVGLLLHNRVMENSLELEFTGTPLTLYTYNGRLQKFNKSNSTKTSET